MTGIDQFIFTSRSNFNLYFNSNREKYFFDGWTNLLHSFFFFEKTSILV